MAATYSDSIVTQEWLNAKSAKAACVQVAVWSLVIAVALVVVIIVVLVTSVPPKSSNGLSGESQQGKRGFLSGFSWPWSKKKLHQQGTLFVPAAEKDSRWGSRRKYHQDRQQHHLSGYDHCKGPSHLCDQLKPVDEQCCDGCNDQFAEFRPCSNRGCHKCKTRKASSSHHHDKRPCSSCDGSSSCRKEEQQGPARDKQQQQPQKENHRESEVQHVSSSVTTTSAVTTAPVKQPTLPGPAPLSTDEEVGRTLEYYQSLVENGNSNANDSGRPSVAQQRGAATMTVHMAPKPKSNHDRHLLGGKGKSNNHKKSLSIKPFGESDMLTSFK